MRSFPRRLAALLFALVAAAARGDAAPSVALFYGQPAPLDELRAFDIAVVDPGHHFDPVAYRRPYSELYAYVSVGEVHPARPYYADVPAAAKLGANPEWGSQVIDLAYPEWPAFLADKVVAPLWAAGYRGFFLDALDAYRRAPAFDEAAEQQGLIRVVATLHRRFPGIRLILNRGFEILPAVGDQVQMVAAESLFRGWDPAAGRYVEVPPADREWLLARLRQARDLYHLPVLAIDYVAPEDRALARATADRIKALGIVPWVTDAKLESLGVGAIEVQPRKLIALYDGREAPAVNYQLLHRFAEMPLNHLGYVLDYVDINGSLPAYPLAGRMAGIVVWTRGAPADATSLAAWLRRQAEAGLRIAVLGHYPLADERSARRLGVGAALRAPAGRLTMAHHDGMFGFEAEPAPDRHQLQPLQLAAGAGTSLLRLADEAGTLYDAAAILPWGGFVLAPFEVAEVPGNDQFRWVVDPFAFFTRALALPPMPVPDTTTENGRRLLFVHIDGDGFASRAELPGRPLAARVLQDVLRRYRLPTTVSVIEGEVSPAGLHPAASPELEALARSIFALPYVAIASHTYSHPFRWDNSVRHGVFGEAGSDAVYHLQIPGYDRLDLRREIVGSRDYIQRRLAPPGKPVDLLLWSGDCAPGADALAIAAAAGLLNLNGGDTAITRSNPSLTAVRSIGIEKGGYRQIYAPIANENRYTNLWRGPYYGFERVLETFALTESPRRLKPIDLYYHAYSATKPAALRALHEVYRRALAQPVHVVHAADYIRKALDFYGAVLARDGDTWIYRGDGSLRTLRAPAALGYPDLAASSGLAGYADGPDARYLNLVGGESRLHFAARPARLPYLQSANARLESWQAHDGRLELTLRGHQPLEFTLAGVQDCRLAAGGRALAPRRQDAGAASFRLDHAAAAIRVDCRDR